MPQKTDFNRKQGGVIPSRLTEIRGFIRVIQTGKTTIARRVMKSTKRRDLYASADETAVRGTGRIERQR